MLFCVQTSDRERSHAPMSYPRSTEFRAAMPVAVISIHVGFAFLCFGGSVGEGDGGWSSWKDTGSDEVLLSNPNSPIRAGDTSPAAARPAGQSSSVSTAAATDPKFLELCLARTMACPGQQLQRHGSASPFGVVVSSFDNSTVDVTHISRCRESGTPALPPFWAGQKEFVGFPPLSLFSSSLVQVG